MELEAGPVPALFRSPMSTFEAEPSPKRSRRPSTLHTPKYVAMDDGGDDTDPEFSPRAPPAVPARRPRQGLGVRGGPSKYRGVVWHKSNSKWEARIYEGGKQKFLGYYTSEEAAAHAYDTYAVRLHGNLQKLNFPQLYAAGAELSHDPGTPPVRHTPSAARASSPLARPPPSPRKTWKSRIQPVKGTSRFRGVSWNSNCAKWRAQVWKGSEVHHLGYFEGEEDAAHAYDEAVLRIRGPDAPTNFPRSQYGALSVNREDEGRGGAGIGASGFRGVSWSEPHQAWLAELWDGSRFQLLGSFRDEASAARRYDLACLELNGADALTNFPMHLYEAELAAVALRAMAMESLWDAGEAAWAKKGRVEAWAEDEELEGESSSSLVLTNDASPVPAAELARRAETGSGGAPREPAAPPRGPAAALHPTREAPGWRERQGAASAGTDLAPSALTPRCSGGLAHRPHRPGSPVDLPRAALPRTLTGSRSSPVLSLAWDRGQQRWVPAAASKVEESVGGDARGAPGRSPTCSEASAASHAAHAVPRGHATPGPSPLSIGDGYKTPPSPGPAQAEALPSAQALQRMLSLLEGRGAHAGADWHAALSLAQQ